MLRGIGCGVIRPLVPAEGSTPEERQVQIRRFVDDTLAWAVQYVTTKMSGTCYDIAVKWSDAVMDMHQV